MHKRLNKLFNILQEINADIADEVEKAAAVARENNVLPKDALYADLYKNTEPQLVRGVTVDEVSPSYLPIYERS